MPVQDQFTTLQMSKYHHTNSSVIWTAVQWNHKSFDLELHITQTCLSTKAHLSTKLEYIKFAFLSFKLLVKWVFCHFTWHPQDAHFLCISLFKQFKESNLLNRVCESTKISWCLKFLFAFQNHLGNQHRLQNRAACFSFKIIPDFFFFWEQLFSTIKKSKTNRN